MLDNILLVQEAIHSSKAQKEKGMVIKLDIANAFDRVRHSFVFVVLSSNQIWIWRRDSSLDCSLYQTPLDGSLSEWQTHDFLQDLKRVKAGMPIIPTPLHFDG